MKCVAARGGRNGSSCFVEHRKHDPKQYACQRKGTAETGVKHGDEYIRRQSGRAEPDAAAHHDRHDDVGFQIEEVPNRTDVLFIAFDSLRVLDAHLKKHQPECAKNNHGQQDVEDADLRNRPVGENAEPCDIDSRDQPHTSGDGQQCPFFLHEEKGVFA